MVAAALGGEPAACGGSGGGDRERSRGLRRSTPERAASATMLPAPLQWLLPLLLPPLLLVGVGVVLVAVRPLGRLLLPTDSLGSLDAGAAEESGVDD